jgi:hypothetical protein
LSSFVKNREISPELRLQFGLPFRFEKVTLFFAGQLFEILRLADEEKTSLFRLVHDTVDRGCQMVSFQTKNLNLGKFLRALNCKMLIYFMAIWNILDVLCSFGTFFPVLES